jgi:hypothetical protein
MSIDFDNLDFVDAGWADLPDERERCRLEFGTLNFDQVSGQMATDDKRTVDLTKYLEKVHGPKWYALTAQFACGSCVSASGSCCINTLEAINHVDNGADLPPVTCIEAMYSLSRVEVGKNRLWTAGSVAAWLVEAAKSYGVVPVGKYASGDFSHYDASRCCGQMSRTALPQDMRAIAAKTTVKKYAAVRNFDEAATAISNGYSVIVASNQGFSKQRDDQGFARPQGSWSHSMAALGVRHDRPGILIANSWMEFFVGSDVCPACFWCDAKVFDRMAAQNDTFAISDLSGWERKGLNYGRLNW